MKNFKIILISFIIGVLAYHFGKPFLVKKFQSKIDEKLDENLNEPETIKDINDKI